MRDLVSRWLYSPHNLSLERNEVHVWRASLNVSAPCLKCVKITLSTNEVARGKRYRFKRDRDHFIAARGFLRLILASYLHMKPNQLQFCYSVHGKPALDSQAGGDTLRFNISHSRGLALYAVAIGRELGVDLEYVRPELADFHIAEHFLSPREVTAFRALPPRLQREAFFKCWVRKEAYIKARGEGLTLPLDQFEVSVTGGDPVLLYGITSDSHDASGWTLKELNLGIGYAAALAVEGHAWKLKCWKAKCHLCMNQACRLKYPYESHFQ